MSRCIAVAIACWIGIAFCMSLGSLRDMLSGSGNTFNRLEIYLAFVYSAFPIALAVLAVFVCGYLLAAPKWLNGVVGAVASSGVVFLFLAATNQLYDDPMVLIPILILAVAGFLIGIAYKPRSAMTT